MRETTRHRLSELENELKPMTSAAIKVTERKPPGRVTLPQDEEILIVNEGAEMSPRRRSAPVRAGGMTVAESPPPRMLTVAEVATYLSVSDDTVLKQFGSLPGVIDIGTSGGMHLRQKRVLRIPQRTLERYIADRQVKATASTILLLFT